MKEKTDNYLESARKGILWSLSHLSEDGSFMGSEKTVAGHYKAPQTLATGGYPREAERVLAYCASRFCSGGDYHHGPEESAAPRFANYRNAWLCWGAHSLGAYDLSAAGGDYLESAQHPSGALAERCEDEADKQVLEWGGTASGTVAFLSAGRVVAAVKTGDALCRMLDSQPEASKRFYLRQNWDGEWITSFDEGVKPFFVVEYDNPGQIYWYFGIGMAALGKLHLATGEFRWLEAGIRIFDMAARMAPESYHALTSAKVGWGASVLYRCTGEQRYADVAYEVGDMLLETQTEVGVWLRRPQFDAVEKQPIDVSVDTTLERCNWLMEITKGLQRGQG